MLLFNKVNEEITSLPNGNEEQDSARSQSTSGETLANETSAAKSQSSSPSHSHDHSHADHAADHHDPAAHFLDPGHLFHHVQDAYSFEVPKWLGSKWAIPDFLGVGEKALVSTASGTPIIKGRMSKFMLLELIAAVLIAALFISLARRIKNGDRPKGRFWNLLEVFVLFIRDEIVRPAIGKHDGDRFLPFLLTLFFFILGLNLLGMVPWLGGATGALGVTAVLALITFLVVVGAGIKKMGVVTFLKSQVPHMDLPKPLAAVLVPGIWVIEMFGLLIKHFVLAIRLFANIFAGHLVLSVFLAFIGATSASLLYWFVGPAVFVGSVAFNLLELFVAFLQAYVFTFLASLFIGAAIHPH